MIVANIHCSKHAGWQGDDKINKLGAKKRGATRGIRLNKLLESMTDEELKEASLEKAPNGCASEFAIQAQKMIERRRVYGY